MDAGHNFKWVPNAITLSRMVSAAVLAWMAFREMHEAFAFLLLPALISDVADGWLARKLEVESSLGATLDSTADILLILVIIYAIWPLHPYVYRDHGSIFIVVTVWLAAGHIGSLLRYGRLASFHTWLIRSGIFTFSLFAVVLFVFGFVPWLLYLAAVVCILGGLEHFVMLALLPSWKPNIYGGLPEVLRMRRERNI